MLRRGRRCLGQLERKGEEANLFASGCRSLPVLESLVESLGRPRGKLDVLVRRFRRLFRDCNPSVGKGTCNSEGRVCGDALVVVGEEARASQIKMCCVTGC